MMRVLVIDMVSAVPVLTADNVVENDGVEVRPTVAVPDTDPVADAVNVNDTVIVIRRLNVALSAGENELLSDGVGLLVDNDMVTVALREDDAVAVTVKDDDMDCEIVIVCERDHDNDLVAVNAAVSVGAVLDFDTVALTLAV